MKKVFVTGRKLAKTPLGKKIVKSAKKTGMQVGVDVVRDGLRGENILKSTKKHTKAAAQELGKNIVDSVLTGVKSRADSGKKRAKSSQRLRPEKTGRPAITATREGTVRRGNLKPRSRRRRKDIF